MGNETEFETRNGRKWETRYIIFLQKTRKTGKKLEKQGKNTKKQEKQEEKKQKITKNTETRFDEVSGNAENGNEFLTRFQEMLKTKMRTKTRSS